MINSLPFKEHLQEYESWFDHHPAVYETEVAALRKLWPERKGIKSLEIGAATGRFSRELNITEALDPELSLLEQAEARGVHTMPGRAEDLPYESNQFDAVLIGTSIHYFNDMRRALKEVYRVLRNMGTLLVAFIDRDSQIGQYYLGRKEKDLFYKSARFYSVDEVRSEMIQAGFVRLKYMQTLFGKLNEISSVQLSKAGYGQGSYVIIKAEKPGYSFPGF